MAVRPVDLELPHASGGILRETVQRCCEHETTCAMTLAWGGQA
jgi:hypothetical protein